MTDFGFSATNYDSGTDVIVVNNNGYAPSDTERVFTTDAAGATRVRNAKIDMGAYEYRPPPPPSGTAILVR